MKKKKIILITEKQAKSLISKLIFESKRFRNTLQNAKTHQKVGLNF